MCTEQYTLHSDNDLYFHLPKLKSNVILCFFFLLLFYIIEKNTLLLGATDLTKILLQETLYKPSTFYFFRSEENHETTYKIYGRGPEYLESYGSMSWP